MTQPVAPGYPQFPNQQFAAAPQGVPQAIPGAPPAFQGAPQPQYAPPAPGGYPGAPQGYAMPPGAPQGYGQPAPQGFAPPMGGMPGVDLGAAIAGANLGITRYPALPVGDHVVVVDLTMKPDRSVALLAELVIERTTSAETQAGNRHAWYQGLGGNGKALEAQQGAALAFILRASGYPTLEALKQSGIDPKSPQWSSHINACFMKPGPLAGRKVGVRVSPSGKLTKPKLNQQGQVVGGGEMIMNYDWYAVT